MAARIRCGASRVTYRHDLGSTVLRAVSRETIVSRFAAASETKSGLRRREDEERKTNGDKRRGTEKREMLQRGEHRLDIRSVNLLST